MKYTNNEAYFDIVEEVDAIIDKSGSTVFAEIQGYVSYPNMIYCQEKCIFLKNNYFIFFCLQIDCCIKLSGMPDLTLSFMNSGLFDDVSFHPCVRFKRWEVGILTTLTLQNARVSKVKRNWLV